MQGFDEGEHLLQFNLDEQMLLHGVKTASKHQRTNKRRLCPRAPQTSLQYTTFPLEW